MTIKFGPSHLGGVKEAIANLEKYKSFGLTACEVPFTYGVYMKPSEAERIGRVAKELGISLSIHASYWINLNSAEKEKVENSKKRILKSCEIGEILGAKRVVFHAGFYGKDSPDQAYENIKRQILEVQEELKNRGYKIKIAPEVMGKINVFGSLDEISKLTKETHCDACIDFAHVLARYKDYKFEEVKKMFAHLSSWHVHFSGINYGEKGEKNHIKTEKEEWKKLIKNLPKNKEITIVNESPFPVDDSVLGLSVYTKSDK